MSLEGPSPGFVSVLIPAAGDSRRLPLCLAALEAQTYPSDRYEVLVLYASQPPPTLSQFPHARLLPQAAAGACAALNEGMAGARGDVFAFTDAESTPAPAWLEQGVKAMDAATGRLVVAGSIELFPREAAAPTAVELYEMLWSLHQEVDVRHGVASSLNLFLPRAAIDKVGPFRTDIGSGGDWEWCGRAGKAGYRFVYAAEALTRKPAISTLRELWQSKDRLAESRFLLAQAVGKTRSRARLDALWESRPPLKGLWRLTTDTRFPGLKRKAMLLFAIVLSRVAFLCGWLRMELASRDRK